MSRCPSSGAAAELEKRLGAHIYGEWHTSAERDGSRSWTGNSIKDCDSVFYSITVRTNPSSDTFTHTQFNSPAAQISPLKTPPPPDGKE
ncbi:hypothetical protein QQF64_024145 [Cirrhinus molitorella]|uniref:Uncharacterized protein n=1 Tax=Cirrhinus molitorella TaxID=172907 RepID=A0ABR3NKE5_9TELE